MVVAPCHNAGPEEYAVSVVVRGIRHIAHPVAWHALRMRQGAGAVLQSVQPGGAV